MAAGSRARRHRSSDHDEPANMRARTRALVIGAASAVLVALPVCASAQAAASVGGAGGVAMAAGSSAQTVDQSQSGSNESSTSQASTSNASTKQANDYAPVSLQGDGSNNGNVTQKNSAETTAVSGNENETTQADGQRQIAVAEQSREGEASDPGSTGSGGYEHGSGGQSVDQHQSGTNENSTSQASKSDASTKQANDYAPVPLQGDGSNNGNVTQKNSAETTAVSGNENETTQAVGQRQIALAEQSQEGEASDPSSSGSGGYEHGSGGQSVDQHQSGTDRNSTEQSSTSNATTEQANDHAPANSTMPQPTSGSLSALGSGAQDTGAADSNATVQAIWQVEISGCIAYCHGITQVQVAEEENTTVQVLEGVPQAVGASPTVQAGAGETAPTTTGILQVQVGCPSRCTGASTSVAVSVAPYQQAVDELLAAIAPVLSSLNLPPASDQNATTQNISQLEDGEGSALEQTESAFEVNTSLQIDELSSTLIAELEAALGSASVSAEQAVNQTEQEIWQLQIGCLMFCAETQQYQLAAQSNTTSQTILPTPGSVAAASSALTNEANELVWQLQIGCMYQCVDTTQQQIARRGYTPVGVAIPTPWPPAAPPPEASTSSPATGAEQTTIMRESASSTSSAAAVAPDSGGVALTPPTFSTVDTSSTAGSRATIKSFATSRVVGWDRARERRSGAPARRRIRVAASTLTPLVVSAASTHIERRQSSVARVHLPRARASSSSVYKLDTRYKLGTRLALGPVAQPVPARGRHAKLGAAIAAGEGLGSDKALLALLAAIVFFVLRFTPRRVRSTT
jgi:hypothetical protein